MNELLTTTLTVLGALTGRIRAGVANRGTDDRLSVFPIFLKVEDRFAVVVGDGPEAGAHTRSAVGMATLPMEISVEIEAEVEIDG